MFISKAKQEFWNKRGFENIALITALRNKAWKYWSWKYNITVRKKNGLKTVKVKEKWIGPEEWVSLASSKQSNKSDCKPYVCKTGTNHIWITRLEKP